MEFLPHVLSSIIAAEHADGHTMPRELFWSTLRQLLLAIRFMHKHKVGLRERVYGVQEATRQ